MPTFIDVLETFNVPYLHGEGHHHCREGWVQMNCPWCLSQNWHLGYSLDRGTLSCWQCGPHQVVSTLAEITEEPYNKIKALIGDLDTPLRQERSKGKLVIPDGVGPLLAAHKQYLRSRNYATREVKTLWGIKGIGPGFKLSWRIFIPIKQNDQTVSWTSRTIGERQLRYISARTEEETFPHKHLLYGEDYARHTIIVVEGPLDVWRIGPGAVATFGTSFSKHQVLRMTGYPTRVICFDKEKVAQQQARRLCRMLSIYPGETFNVVLDKKDPSASSDKDIRKLRKLFLETK